MCCKVSIQDSLGLRLILKVHVPNWLTRKHLYRDNFNAKKCALIPHLSLSPYGTASRRSLKGGLFGYMNPEICNLRPAVELGGLCGARKSSTHPGQALILRLMHLNGVPLRFYT